MVKSSRTGISTDIDSHYSLNLNGGNHNITVSYIGYADTTVVAPIGPGEEVTVLDISLSPKATSLSEVTVMAVARKDKDTEVAMIDKNRQNDMVQTDVSVYKIAKTQDIKTQGDRIVSDHPVLLRG